MEFVCTPDEMRAADERTIAAGTPEPVLMARAASALAWAARQLLGGTYGRRVVVVAGGGNNGGDGLLAADRLGALSVRVECVRLDAFDREIFERALGRAHLVVDAMFGTGFRGALEGDAAFVVGALADSRVPVLAADIPSGVDGLTGAVAGPAVAATHTVCFAARKRGVCFEPGRTLAGMVTVADIGIEVPDPGVGVVTAADVRGWLPARAVDANKWSNAVLVIGGSRGMTGAPVFVSQAALRAGAGMVHCALPGEAAVDALAGAEVVLRALPATDAGGFATDAARVAVEAAPRFGAVALGPGLGSDGRAVEMARRVIAEVAVPLVVDADGLNAMAGDLAPVRVRRTAGLPTPVLTPHDGEYTRLVGHPPGLDRVAAARELADAAQAVVLLKGPTTVVAAPDGRVALSLTGGPELATAGTGDVLTGMLAAFCARGMAVFEAAAAAAWVHGGAAQTAGPVGIVAHDLVTALAPTLERLDKEQ